MDLTLNSTYFRFRFFLFVFPFSNTKFFSLLVLCDVKTSLQSLFVLSFVSMYLTLSIRRDLISYIEIESRTSKQRQNTKMSDKRQTIRKEISKLNEKKKNYFKPKTADEEEETLVNNPDFFEVMKNIYGSEREIFKEFKINPNFFRRVLNSLREVSHNGKGKKSFFFSLESKVLLLILYLEFGGPRLIRLMVYPHLKTCEQITRIFEKTLEKFTPVLVGQFIEFENDLFEETEYSCIIDCTIIKRAHPVMRYTEAMKFYSGKSSCYCFKKQCIININSGKCCLVSPAYPGSIHDMKILKETAEEVNDMLGETSILADLGYVGMEKYVPNSLVPSGDEEELALKKKRSFIERYFGRLKTRFNILCVNFPLDDKWVDLAFDCCCALLNIELDYQPLNRKDKKDYETYLSTLEAEQKERARNKQITNQLSRRSSRDSLNYIDGEDQ